MSKIAVSGGAGFIGSHLVDKLIEGGHEVIVLDNLSSGKEENLNSKAKFILGDVRKLGFVKTESYPINNNIDYIFHLAAIPRVPYSVEHPIETQDVNVNGTIKILEFARKCKVNKVIFASSSSVYGDAKLPLREDFSEKAPKSPYAMQKRFGELLMRLYNDLYDLPTVSLRFFNVYGPRCDPNSEYSLVIGKFLKQRSEGKPLTIYGDGEQTRDFTYVSDVILGLTLAMEKNVRGVEINLCNGNNTSINKIAELVGGEKQYLPPRVGDVLHTKGSNKRAKDLLGWEPLIKIEEGIKLI